VESMARRRRCGVAFDGIEACGQVSFFLRVGAGVGGELCCCAVKPSNTKRNRTEQSNGSAAVRMHRRRRQWRVVAAVAPPWWCGVGTWEPAVPRGDTFVSSGPGWLSSAQVSPRPFSQWLTVSRYIYLNYVCTSPENAFGSRALVLPLFF
jgi:hypothetical protein